MLYFKQIEQVFCKRLFFSSQKVVGETMINYSRNKEGAQMGAQMKQQYNTIIYENRQIRLGLNKIRKKVNKRYK